MERADEARPALIAALKKPNTPRSQETWLLWTLGRISPVDRALDGFFSESISQPDSVSLNRRIQSQRILAHRSNQRENANSQDPTGSPGLLTSSATSALDSSEPRVRHEAIQAIWQARRTTALPRIIDRAAV